MRDQVDYYPSEAQLQAGQTAQGVIYSVQEEHSDQGPEGRGTNGSVTVERITIQPVTTHFPTPTNNDRDVLYVVCGSPSANDANPRWTSVMRAAVDGLGQRHAGRALYFVLVVGLEWLPFYWDPNSPAPAGRALRMAGDGARGEGNADQGWYVSPNVHPPPGIDAGHIDAHGIVRAERARSLDCFTAAPSGAAGGVSGLAFQDDLDFLEEFIRVVERHPYVGENEPSLE